MRIVITAGPTREHLDAVRFLSNPSSGKMGFALADVAVSRGHEVTLVSGPVALVPCDGLEQYISVTSAEEMYRAVHQAVREADALIMSAAVADWSPESPFQGKRKKGNTGHMDVRFVRTPDILMSLADSKGDRIHIGFAAEYENLEEHAREKLRVKNLDMIVANDISQTDTGFASDENAVILIDSEEATPVSRAEKDMIAGRILDWLEARKAE